MYEKSWKRLIDEVNFLIEQGVHSIDPIILRGYMDFIQERIEMESSLDKPGSLRSDKENETPG